ncbi:ABC transporter ATP-binding protein [Oharaeibacter diazotrophicus]|uniref:Carbohydrate ABC transporter ATP-binding protein (CUT1 family) n=1 Tax=Oharaeibacter diazotrophicus TaxID=1920512 RepID=A0A4R6R8Y5_9HYPH|nr:ABC transporter ATP-binding protein [Oharaeibacter diazotrophicus]TDP82511.1 carbohydrate ABC transporter ATP-binding protein (CUT1 family) [Oharaeibacter diazotrophicus]BBE72725.1 trehalose import ATP-binding protein SugC [Pleomorphomonas sp. SM30]GLS76761.1 ABC transporter ATP-binding protein [Oharaeibacter diazotrophicus]
MAEIRVEKLHKAFGAFTAVKESSFTVADGEFFVMLGPSGCGKTTTLRMIAGLELPTSGTITLGGEDVTFARASRRDIAFVFQLFALYPHMNVRANISYPLRNQGVAKAEIAARVEETARILRISHLLDRSVSGLSSGDRQRVALGRAIVRKPLAFMMDEPLGALDTEMREVMIGELRALHDRLGATTIYVTHDQHEAMAMADKIAVMNRGAIEQFATPQEIYDRPASLFVADFIGQPSMNLIRFHGAARRGDTAVAIGEHPVGVGRIGADLTERALVLGVRPEHIRLVDGGVMPGRALGAEYLGTQQIVTLETPYGAVRARVPADRRVDRGELVGLDFLPERVSLFDGASGAAIPTGGA